MEESVIVEQRTLDYIDSGASFPAVKGLSYAKLMFIRRQVSDAFLLTQKRRMLAEIRLKFGLRVGVPLESLRYTEILFNRSKTVPSLYVIVNGTPCIYEASVYPKTEAYSFDLEQANLYLRGLK